MTKHHYATETAETVLGDDGIIRVHMRPGTTETLATARENVDALADLCGDNKHPLLIDMTGTRGASQDARRHYSSERVTQRVSAAAMLVPTPVSKVLGNFFLGLNKPRHALRLFTSEAEALEWLRDYRS